MEQIELGVIESFRALIFFNLVHELDKQSEFKLAISTTGVNFFYFMSYFVFIMYAKSLLTKANPSIKPGDVMTVYFYDNIIIWNDGS